jgi:ribosomal protein S3
MGFGAIGSERKRELKIEKNILGHDIYRETPGKLKIMLSSDNAGRLIGEYGSTIKRLRKKHKSNEIYVSRERPRYVELSGKNLMNVYFDVMGIL